MSYLFNLPPFRRISFGIIKNLNRFLLCLCFSLNTSITRVANYISAIVVGYDELKEDSKRFVSVADVYSVMIVTGTEVYCFGF